MAEPLLRVENVSKRFGGLLAVDRASLTRRSRPHHRADRAERRRQDHAVRDHHRLPARRPRAASRYDGDDITGEPPHRLARRGIARTFQIVQPFAGLTVRENIAVGAHLSRPRARRRARGGRARSRSAVGLARPARSPGREPHGRRPQAAGACARARDRAEAAAARRGAGRAQPVRDPRHGAGDPRHPRPRHHHRDDRARHAGGDEPRRARVRAGRRAASSPRARRRRSPRDPRVVEAYLGHGAAERMQRRRRMAEPLLAVSGLHAGYGATEILRGIDLAVARRRDRRGAGLERRRQVDAQPHHLRRAAAVARRDPLRRRGDRARAARRRSWRAA